MEKILISVCLVVISYCGLSAFPDSLQYAVEIDLKNIENDQVKVVVHPPVLSGEKAIYNMPKIVPGTYSISDFGQFVDGIEAIDVDGNNLEVVKLDVNRWEISNISKLSHLSYRVNDSFDEPGGAGIFEPAGTNIDNGKNIVFNGFGFVGYFDGAKHNAYELTIAKPDEFYGETSLRRIESSSSDDVFYAKDYFEFHDCPILYAEPDTTSMMVAGTRIAVSVYSPNKTISANDVMETVEDIFPAAANYLGGDLPVDQYTLLVYLSDGMAGGTGSFGALEHNTSTVFYLPEAPMQALEQTFKDVTAHEFFHIVTPLNIHSEEIDDYDFVNPKMSKHLWLYEGCTEYAAQHVQVKEGLMSTDDFLKVIQQKMLAASGFDSGVAFTEMSKKALGEHADLYGNVYQQGALIGMAIDLKLRYLSSGNYGIQDLMKDLAAEYGQEKPFKDDDLFEEIGRVSGYPEMVVFLNNHVAGTDPLPFDDLLGYAGILFKESSVEKVVTGGGVALGYNPATEKLVVASTEDLDEFGEAMGFEVGDEIVSWNGNTLTLDNIQDELDAFRQDTKPGDKVSIVVLREVKKGKMKTMKLKAKAISVERTRRNVLQPMENPTSEQLEIRKAWINN